MKCVTCNIKLDHQTFIFCDDCLIKRERAYLKAQIGLMGRLAKRATDPADVEEIAKRQIEYLVELQSATF